MYTGEGDASLSVEKSTSKIIYDESKATINDISQSKKKYIAKNLNNYNIIKTIYILHRWR